MVAKFAASSPLLLSAIMGSFPVAVLFARGAGDFAFVFSFVAFLFRFLDRFEVEGETVAKQRQIIARQRESAESASPQP
jgi:hypothetical protein